MRLQGTGSRNGRGRRPKECSDERPETPHVPISKIDVDSGSNVRTHIDKEKLQGLTASIEAVGVVTPLDVRPKENGRFDLISGERRYLAAELAGLKEVPVIFGKGNAHLSKVVENLQTRGPRPD